MKTLLVTGGCGFIGSSFIRLLNAHPEWRVVNLDKLTYAGNLANLQGVEVDERYRFVHGDICDRFLLERVLKEEKPCAIVNFAAESHVDRSILDASSFVSTNIAGVQAILETIRTYSVERFLQISTDEVYGDMQDGDRSSEESALAPSSPYAATKAAADLLCLSYRRTYGVPVLITRSTNNYGPYQFPEKLIPLLIRNGLNGMDLPVYGDGKQIRDWLYVEDNCRAILSVLNKGQIGSIYNIATAEERTNFEVVESICVAIAERTMLDLKKLKESIRHITDRPGHDRRYAIDAQKIRTETGWKPCVEFAAGLKRTVDWYLGHSEWIANIASEEYDRYYDSVYARAWSKAQQL